MIYTLHAAQLRRMHKHELKQIAEQCERALLDGTSTQQDMISLIEVEKELLRREQVKIRQGFEDVRKTMVESLVINSQVKSPTKV
jgi:hypothetical protein